MFKLLWFLSYKNRGNIQPKKTLFKQIKKIGFYYKLLILRL